MKFNTIKEALQAFKQGEMLIVLDDESRENEGDIIFAAEHSTPEKINFLVSHAKGLICAPITQELASKLNLNPMIRENRDPNHTAFTISIDHKDSTTGISAFERSNTLFQLTQNPEAKDFYSPGHIFPLIAKDGGVIERDGHTEAAVDLCRLTGLKEVGVICEILDDDGTMKRRDSLLEFAQEHNLKIITIEALQKYILTTKRVMEKVTEANLPTRYGNFKIHGFVNRITKEHHVALTIGDVSNNALVRVHSECLTGDALGSKKCDCGEQYDEAMKRIAENKNGILIYMRQEGRGIGLINKIKAYNLQDQGYDTVDANLMLGFKDDERQYNESADILKILGANNIKLMTNNPLKIEGLEEYGITVQAREHIEPNHNEYNDFYMQTKKQRMNHKLY